MVGRCYLSSRWATHADLAQVATKCRCTRLGKADADQAIPRNSNQKPILEAFADLPLRRLMRTEEPVAISNPSAGRRVLICGGQEQSGSYTTKQSSCAARGHRGDLEHTRPFNFASARRHGLPQFWLPKTAGFDDHRRCNAMLNMRDQACCSPIGASEP
jgi:hypothetical protein